MEINYETRTETSTSIPTTSTSNASDDGSPLRLARLQHMVALCICLLALLAAAWVATAVFDRLPHLEDDVAFLFQAQTIASGRIIADSPPLPEFFATPFVIDQDGDRFGKYPIGYPLFFAIGVLSGHPWLFNPFVGALAVGLTYLAGRRLYGPVTGLVAAALLAISPFFLLQAGAFLSHVSSLFWAMAFLLLFERTRRTRSLWIGLLAGIAIGMLLLSRPLTAVGIGLPYAIWIGIDIVRDRSLLRHYLLMGITCLPFAGMLLGYNRMTTGDPFQFAYELWWPYDRVGFGDGYGYGDGHSVETGWFNTQRNLEALSDYLFGWPAQLSLIPALVASTVAMITIVGYGAKRVIDRGTRTRTDEDTATPPVVWDLLQIGIVVGLITVHVAYWTAGQMYGPRYYFEAMGALVLLSARGIVQTSTSLGILLKQIVPQVTRPHVWTSAATFGVVGLLFIHSYVNFAPDRFEEFTGWYGIDRSGLRVIEQQDIKNAVVFVATESWTDYAPFFTENRPSLDTEIVYARDLGGRNRELMDLYPNRAYYHYADGELVRLEHP